MAGFPAFPDFPASPNFPPFSAASQKRVLVGPWFDVIG